MLTVEEREFDVPAPPLRGGAADSLLAHFEREIRRRLAPNEAPVRFAVTATGNETWRVEIGVLRSDADSPVRLPSLFRLAPRPAENQEAFTAVLLVPTGIGCPLGGHAGDAGAAARLLGAVCDRLVLHPNVVNASDLNEMPENALYVEGSVIARWLLGEVGLRPVRANRVLVVMDGDREEYALDAVVNSVNAGRATYGLSCPKVVALDPPVRLRASYTQSGRAVGSIERLERLLEVLRREAGTYDAVALSGVVHMPFQLYMEYLQSEGDAVVNPMGGAEAILTHSLSLLSGIPSAHAPMYVAPESLDEEIMPANPGVVDPRMAAEVVSIAFIQSVLKGLGRFAPRIVPLESGAPPPPPGVLTAAEASCLIVPDGTIGLPLLAALEQGIPVIAVRGNRGRLHCDLSRLSWKFPGQLIYVENYLEAAGALAALRAGLSLESVRRPLERVGVEYC